jgi:hypothetical protein
MKTGPSKFYHTGKKTMKKPVYNLIFKAGILLAAVLMLYGPALAQTPKVAQSGMTWLNMPLGARAAGMGYANVAVVNDASSFFWNPAGYAFTGKTTFFANRTNWIADINVNSLAMSFNAGRWGVYGFNLTGVDWGTFHGTRRADNEFGYVETGTFSPASMSAGFSYAYRISNEFAVGTNIKYLYERLGSSLVGSFDDPESITAKMQLLAVDFGTIYYFGFHDLRFGMSLRNFSNEEAYRVETFPLPMTFRFGAAMDLFKPFVDETYHELTLAVDFIHSRDYSERLNVGAEYAFRDLFFLRGGYKINYDLESFSAGAGVKVEAAGIKARVDYAYIQMDLFDGVNMFTLDFGF